MRILDKADKYPPGHGYSRRPDGARPQAIIVHTTNNPRATQFQGEIDFLFTSPDVGAHYLIGKSEAAGVVQFFDPARYAPWHSGDCAPNIYENPTSIGIEMHVSVGQRPTAYQIGALTELVQHLMAQFRIPADRVASHRAVAVPPGRKRDPEGFPEATFAAWRATLAAGPTPPPPAPERTYRVLHHAWVRSTPSITGRHVGSLLRGTLVSGALVRGKAFHGNDQWLDIDGTRFVWAGALEAL